MEKMIKSNEINTRKLGDKAQFNFLLGAAKNFSSPAQKVIYSGAIVGENDFSKIFTSALFHTTDIEHPSILILNGI